MRPRSRPVLPLAALLACHAPQSETTTGFTTDPPPPGTSDTSTGSSTGSGRSSGSSSTGGELSTGSGSGGASTGAASTGAASTFDVGTMQDFGPGKPPGCEGRIDFLFVISRYGGMKYFQDQLVAAFPEFIDTIEAKFADFDYHIMIVDGDPDWGLDTCDAKCPMPCAVPGYPCDYTPTTCDTTMGAGVVFPAGGGASNTLCKIDGGRRYMSKGQTDLKNAFACAAQVGYSGGDWMGEASTAAMLPAINSPGGCNDGFLRDDALLVVTLISNTIDEVELGSKGTPGGWAAAVLNAKHGDPESVVFLNINSAEYPDCHEKDRVCQMIKMFPYSLLENLNAPSYGPAFDKATDLITTACADFVPPG
jgi:hypothetical protein